MIATKFCTWNNTCTVLSWHVQNVVAMWSQWISVPYELWWKTVREKGQGFIWLTVFPSQFKCDHRATKFCPCCAVVLCAKFCSDNCISIWVRAKRNSHHILIVMEKLLVKWALELLISWSVVNPSGWAPALTLAGYALIWFSDTRRGYSVVNFQTSLLRSRQTHRLSIIHDRIHWNIYIYYTIYRRDPL